MRTTSHISQLTALLLAASTPAGICLLSACESLVPTSGTESTGTLGMQLTVPGGSGISSLAYTISGGPTAKSGTIDVSKSGTVSAILGGLAAGSGYTIAVTGMTDGGDTCVGSAGPFTVTAEQTVSVSLVIACHEPSTNGNVSVRGTLDACPEIRSVSAVPSEVTVGNDVAIAAVAGPDESDAGHPLVYTWTGLTSSDAKGNATFHCATPGSFSVSVAVTDGVAACDSPPDPAATATVTVTCDPSSTSQPPDASAGTPRIVLFGGQNAATEYNDTWEWDGANWSLRSPATSPSARSYVSLAFDSVRGRTVFFSGTNGNALLTDTWEWDGTTWLQPQPVPVPPARAYAALAFDSVRGVTVMFGGEDGGVAPLGDTWEWDGTTWAQRTPSVSPPPRWGSGIAFDSQRGTIVLFGGFGGSPSSGAPLGDTWEWDGTTWTQRTSLSAVSPAPRYACAMTFDSARGKTVVFGGTDLNGSGGSNSSLGDTWEWDGSTWTESSTSGPSGREYMPMAYDPAHQVTVLFGGQTGPDLGYQKFAETWTWDGSSWAQLSPAASPPARIAHGMVFAYE